MEKLKLDLDEIASAMGGVYGGEGAVLDLKTGNVIYLSEEFLYAVSPEDDLGITRDVADKLLNAWRGELPEGFVHIPARDSRDGFGGCASSWTRRRAKQHVF